MSKIIVTGATGFVGTSLVAAARARGDTVVPLARNAAAAEALLGIPAVAADLENPGAWQATLDGADAVIHLAGEPIADGRWDARRKQRLRDSRVESARRIVEGIAALPAARRPRVLVTASGSDFYPFAEPRLGFDDDEITEADPPGEHFLGRLCHAWEAAADEAAALGVRVVAMRTGLVLGPGGALARLTTVFKRFAGGPLGSGKQWLSWIHRDDVVAAYLAAVTDERYVGPINLVAPETVRQRDFARALGHALGRPAILPAPGFALRMALGEFADFLPHGRRVVPAALTRLGFTFARPTLKSALDAPGKSREP